jgi:hypothetical protein
MFKPHSLLASQIVPTAASCRAGRPRLLRPSRTCVVTFARIGYAIRLTQAIGGTRTFTSQDSQPCRLLTPVCRRFMFFSKRAFNALSSSSRCSGDKSFLLLLMFRALVAVIVVASRVFYLLLRCAPPHGFFFGLSLRSYQFAVSTPFGVHPSVHPRSPPPGEYACVPSFPRRQESAGKSRAPPPQNAASCSSVCISFRTPCLRGQRSKFPASYTKSRQSCVGVLFRPL